jgi:hypothetical protein
VGLSDWMNKRAENASTRFGKGCANAMIKTRNKERAQVSDVFPDSTLSILTVSNRLGWSVEAGGDLIHKGQKIGHTVTEKMGFDELVYIVVSVETFARLGSKAAAQTLGVALVSAHEALAEAGLASREGPYANPYSLVTKGFDWAGSFYH